MSNRINWIAVRTAYVVKGWSAARCAQEFGVDISTVKKRASKEGWTEERTRNATLGSEVVAERMREAVDEQIALGAASAVDTVNTQLETLAVGSRLAHKLAKAAEALLDKYLNEKENVGKSPGEFVFGISAGEKQSQADVLNAIADAVKKAATVGREISGVRPGQPNVAQENTEDAGKMYEVVIEPEAQKIA